MLKAFLAFARDDAAVKSLFEHCKNLTVGISFLAIAAWFHAKARPGWPGVWDNLAFAIVALVGVALLWVNHLNLVSNVALRPWHRWVKIVFILIYVVVVEATISFTRGTS